MSGHLDQADPDTMAEMRCYVCNRDGLAWEDAERMTDAEVMDRLDGSYPGGSAQFNREERDWTGEDWNHLPRSDSRLI